MSLTANEIERLTRSTDGIQNGIGCWGGQIRSPLDSLTTTVVTLATAMSARMDALIQRTDP